MPNRLDTSPTSDFFEEILLCSRYGELPELKQTLALIEPSSIDKILHQQDSRGNTPLHFCSANGHLEIAEYLATLQSSGLDIQNEGGNTALHWACLNGHLSVVKSLANAGSDVKLKNKGGRMPIDEAESQGKEAVVLWLLALDMKREKEAGVFDAANGEEETGEDGDIDVNVSAGVGTGERANEQEIGVSTTAGEVREEEFSHKVDAMDMLD